MLSYLFRGKSCHPFGRDFSVSLGAYLKQKRLYKLLHSAVTAISGITISLRYTSAEVVEEAPEVVVPIRLGFLLGRDALAATA